MTLLEGEAAHELEEAAAILARLRPRIVAAMGPAVEAERAELMAALADPRPGPQLEQRQV